MGDPFEFSYHKMARGKTSDQRREGAQVTRQSTRRWLVGPAHSRVVSFFADAPGSFDEHPSGEYRVILVETDYRKEL